MSDLTTDLTASEVVQTRKKAQRTEFMVYYAIIFAATLPLATLTWALQAVRQRSLRGKGPGGYNLGERIKRPDRFNPLADHLGPCRASGAPEPLLSLVDAWRYRIVPQGP